MYPVYRSLLCATALACLAMSDSSQAARAEDWGNLSGRFLYDGTAPQPVKIDANKDPEVCGKQPLHEESLEVAADGGLANVVVYVRTDNVPVAPSYAADEKSEVLLDNKGCRFEPHVALLRTTQTLVIKNSDPVGHNSKVSPLKNQEINPIIPSGEEVKQQFPQEENLPIKVGCNIHPWMGAWVLVRKSPYEAVSDKEGKFEIKDLPVGKELEFQIWQEKAGNVKEAKIEGVKLDSKGRFKIKIKAGDNSLGDIKVSPKSFK